ncbi:MAG: UDP-N-acetylmuramoyl-L-alanyl-D-glutamate--2,6-diaminopimelate ligase [Candidatus Omnitrophota bacterium]|nr:UDP-N-acetylmuramoyl-L-alanyl-D-glutamate--2,6-diaminopimelate ligase [Candidatus Omnitrophota bacterium]
MRINELIRQSGIVKAALKLEDFAVAGLSCNSKAVRDGFVFVAVKGAAKDGHEFIREAIENGARVVIAQSGVRGQGTAPDCIGTIGVPLTAGGDRVPVIRVKDTRQTLGKLAACLYGNPAKQVKAVGVTGTNGKTTVTYLIEAILQEAGRPCGVIGTINYRFQDSVLPSTNTTPGPLELQSMLAGMLKSGIQYCVMEVSSHALDQQRTAGMEFCSAVFTNLAQDHLDYHKKISDYFLAKAKLFSGLRRDAVAVLNSDDKFYPELRKLTQAKIFSYGIKKDARFRAKEIRFSASGTEFTLSGGERSVRLKSGLIGRHNVYNILAAAAWALAEGIGPLAIKSAVEKLVFVSGRLERINPGGNFAVFVDYAHTEDALKNILISLRQISDGRIIVVFGCGGDRDKSKRPKMGRVVSRLADYAIITNDNPRGEEPIDIIRDIERGMIRDNYYVIPDRAEAIRKSLSIARRGDIVLVAGKGHESYQIVKDKSFLFDDREVARECLKLMSS